MSVEGSAMNGTTELLPSLHRGLARRRNLLLFRRGGSFRRCGFATIEIANDLRDVLPRLAVRRDAVILLHTLRTSVVGGERFGGVSVILHQQFAKELRPAVH